MTSSRPSENFQDRLGELERSLELTAGTRARVLARKSYEAVLERAAEIALLCNPEMISLLRTPDVYIGRERNEIARIVGDLIPVHYAADLTDMFVALVHGRVVHRSAKQSVENVLEELLRASYADGACELRCKNCGYHFMARDMGAARRELVTEMGVRLALETPAGRFVDPWKSATDKDRTLTVDHIVPEAALGPTVLSNVQVLCSFCNKRKQIFRTHLEVFGARVGASLLTLTGGSRGQWAIEAAVYFAMAEQKACGYVGCGRDASEVELTALPISRERRWTGIAPWLLEVRCYDHVDLESTP